MARHTYTQSQAIKAMSDEELNQWVEELLAGGNDEETWRESLGQVLDANRELRDNNFVHPESVVVFTEATNTLEEVPVWELPLRFPLQGHGARWCLERIGGCLHTEVRDPRGQLLQGCKAVLE